MAGTTEKRIQRKAREVYGCDVCGKTIWANCEYMAVTCQNVQGMRVRYKRHIHCDALVRLYAERQGMDPAEVKSWEVLEWLKTVCDAECMPGFSQRCNQDRFSCGQIVWLLLRNKPGYGAIAKSTEQCRREDD